MDPTYSSSSDNDIHYTSGSRLTSSPGLTKTKSPSKHHTNLSCLINVLKQYHIYFANSNQTPQNQKRRQTFNQWAMPADTLTMVPDLCISYLGLGGFHDCDAFCSEYLGQKLVFHIFDFLVFDGGPEASRNGNLGVVVIHSSKLCTTPGATYQATELSVSRTAIISGTFTSGLNTILAVFLPSLKFRLGKTSSVSAA